MAQRWQVYGVALLAVSLVTLGAMPLRTTLTLANFTMVYLLLVVIVAIRGGIRAAILSALAAFMAINFFLVPPFYSLRVADPREVLDLAVFLIVATIAGRLSAQAHQKADEAQSRAHEQAILYRLSRAFNQLSQPEGVYTALTHALQTDLGAVQAQVLPHQSLFGAADTPHYLLLQSGTTIYGTVQVVFTAPLTALQSELLQTCVAQAAMALQRIDLIERANKSHQFEEADKLKTALLHAVSHDLRTPITIIKSSASNLRQFQAHLSPAEQQEMATTIENEVDLLDHLVGNLLDLSRLKAGAVRLNSELNSLEEVAGDVAAQVWQRTKQERIRLHFPENLPLVRFDYGLLLQAVSNLVDNSLRYEPPHSQIEIGGALIDQTAQLYIVNHGATIPAEVRAHMFEPFYRGAEGRIGLGLPIAQGIIAAHQGRLTMNDTPGGGATFVIELPYVERLTNVSENPDRG
jgi:two-component system sensor histidine kinase KdpD